MITVKAEERWIKDEIDALQAKIDYIRNDMCSHLNIKYAWCRDGGAVITCKCCGLVEEYSEWSLENDLGLGSVSKERVYG